MIVVRTKPGVLKRIYDELKVPFSLPADFSAYLIVEKRWDAKGFRREVCEWTPTAKHATIFMDIDQASRALTMSGAGKPERYEVAEL